jgi:hypothetical protein
MAETTGSSSSGGGGGGMISFSGTDWLGIGESVGAGHDARHVEGCGAKPTCSTSTSSCTARQNAFNECTAREQDLRMMEIQSFNNRSADQGASNNRKFIIIAIIIVIALLIIKKKRK